MHTESSHYLQWRCVHSQESGVTAWGTGLAHPAAAAAQEPGRGEAWLGRGRKTWDHNLLHTVLFFNHICPSYKPYNIYPSEMTMSLCMQLISVSLFLFFINKLMHCRLLACMHWLLSMHTFSLILSIKGSFPPNPSICWSLPLQNEKMLLATETSIPLRHSDRKQFSRSLWATLEVHIAVECYFHFLSVLLRFTLFYFLYKHVCQLWVIFSKKFYK